MQNIPKFDAATRLATSPTRRIVAGQLLTMLTVAFLPMASRTGHADSYPERTIKIVVPFPAGGPTDIAARLASQIVQSSLGQAVIIENRPGAGGAIGTRAGTNSLFAGALRLWGDEISTS